MARTHQKVRNAPPGEDTRPAPEVEAADRVEQALRLLEGRWKLELLFRLFGGKVRRFSELERTIPGISQKMLNQQLRQMESDGLVKRTVYPEVPPKVEYSLTDWGQALCPVLDALLKWAEQRGSSASQSPLSIG